MNTESTAQPESTSARTALWRALHLEVDPPPHVLEDAVGLQLLEPDAEWRSRPDMNPEATKHSRLSIVTRARIIEDLVVAEVAQGVKQYVILGAGIDTFAQRRKDVASQMRVFEVDKPAPQVWKRQRLDELGYGVPDWLHFVGVDFEAGESWWQRLLDAGFDVSQPAVVVSTGVSMYLTREATLETLRDMAKLAKGSTFVMTFLVPLEMTPPEERTEREFAENGARRSGTPFVSFYSPDQMVALALEAGFREAECVPVETLQQRYFSGRTDGLKPPASERILFART